MMPLFNIQLGDISELSEEYHKKSMNTYSPKNAKIFSGILEKSDEDIIEVILVFI